MDPISQGLVGATFSQVPVKKNFMLPAAILGFVSGIAADLDVFFVSKNDPLLFLEYHRQFTHSLIFIPIGAGLVTILMYLIFRKYFCWLKCYFICICGYATHAVLDSCTSYGTQLLWPFSDMRVAWNNISIIDPLFTMPILILVVLGAIRKSKWLTYAGCAWCLFYLSFGLFQNFQATKVAQALAVSRGHTFDRLFVKPSFANLLLWKSIYEYKGKYYIDAIRIINQPQYCPGSRIDKLNIEADLPNLNKISQQALDVERFREFSKDYLAFQKEHQLVMDVRYSMVPNELKPLWGIIVKTGVNKKNHVEWWESQVPAPETTLKFLSLLRGIGCFSLE